MIKKTRTPRESELIASVTIHLIKEELKNRKLFQTLRKLGVRSTFYQADLAVIIMVSIGLPIESLDLIGYCHNLLNNHAQRVTEDFHELAKEARQVYDQLKKRVPLT